MLFQWTKLCSKRLTLHCTNYIVFAYIKLFLKKKNSSVNVNTSRFTFSFALIYEINFFHEGASYHIKTSPLIGTSVMKEFITKGKLHILYGILVKTVNGFYMFIIFVKSSIMDVCQDSKFVVLNSLLLLSYSETVVWRCFIK